MPAWPRYGVVQHHRRDLADGLLPHLALGRALDLEACELHVARRLARAELDAPVGHEVERRDPLGDAGGMVVTGQRGDDAVPQADVLGALARGGEEHLGRGRVAVLLEEVVLDLPHRVEPESVRELDLLERLLDDAVLRVRVPRSRELVLVEDAELHGAS